MTRRVMIFLITLLCGIWGIHIFTHISAPRAAVCTPYPECLNRPPTPPLVPGVYPIDPPICVGCGCSGGYFDEQWVDFNLPGRANYRKVRFFVTWYCSKWGQTLRIHNQNNQILLEGECWGHVQGWSGFVSTDVARLWIYPCGHVGGYDWGWVWFDSLELVQTVPENMLKSSATGLNFELGSNYPNPFNPETQINYALADRCQVKLSVYNVRGQRVRILVNEFQAAGHNSVIWDGKNEDGHEVASGIYFYRLDAGTFTDTKSMVLLK